MEVRGTYSGEEIEVSFSADGCLDEGYWMDLENIEVMTLTICNVPVNLKELPETLRKAILELADEVEFN